MLTVVARRAMCQLAANHDSDWIMVDTWESIQSKYTPTTALLDHFNNTLNTKLGGIEAHPGTRKDIAIILLAGAE